MHSFMEILFPMDSSHIDGYNYIIEPICLTGKLKQTSKLTEADEAKVLLNIEVDNFSVKLHKHQYDSICRLAEAATDYSKFQMLYNATKRFKFLRPIRDINSLKRENILTSENVTNENAVLWWQYAIKAVIKLQREKKGALYEFRISRDKKRNYEKLFLKEFQKYLLNQEYDEDTLHHIIVAVDRTDLEKWVTFLTKQRLDKEERSKNEAGWFGFFRQKRVEEELKDEDNISAEEIENVYKTLHDKFAKDEDKEEQKDPSEIISLKAELLVQKGGLNLIYNKVDMKLFFHDIGLAYKQFGDGNMMIDAQTRDFGLEMDSDQHFQIIEKMDGSEVFWKMQYLKSSHGKQIDHSLDLTINPIKVIYEGSFIKTIVQFFKNDTELQIKEQAAEKWADFKEGAGTQIQQAVKQKDGKNINIVIYSPILLIPLRQNDPTSKIWAINLGNFTLSSETPDKNYDHYKFVVDSAMMKFYKNYAIWEKCAKEEISQRKKCKENDEPLPEDEISLTSEEFTVLEEFQVECGLAVNTGYQTPKGRGEVEVLAKVSPVKFNLNNHIYNQLVTIHRSFTYEDPEEIVQDMISQKEKVMSKAILISNLKKRGNNIKTFANRFAVISGTYLYFYRESNDLMDEEHMFLKDAHVIDMSDKVGEKHALDVSSKFGSVLLAFNDQATKDQWRNQIHRIVIELNANNEHREEIAIKENEQAQIDANKVLFSLNACCPEVKATWYELDGSIWASANLNDLNLNVKKPYVGIRISLGIGSGQAVNHSDIPNYNVVATSQKPEKSSNNFVEVEIDLNERPENPSGDEIVVNLRVGYLMLHFFPPFIKSMVSRVRLIRYEYEYDIEEIKSHFKDRISKLEEKIINAIKDGEGADSPSLKIKDKPQFTSHDCEKFPLPYIIVKVSLSEVEGDFLHHLYATPIAKLKIGQTQADYDMYVDHDELTGNLGGIRLFDMTNYPYTADPRNIKNFRPDKMFEVLGLRDSNEKNTLNFACKFFTDSCPKKKANRTNSVKLYVSSIKYIFQLDYLMRIKDFFFDRFLDSVTDTNPYEDEKANDIEEKLIRFHDKEEIEGFNLNQEDSIIDLY